MDKKLFKINNKKKLLKQLNYNIRVTLNIKKISKYFYKFIQIIKFKYLI